MRTIITTTILFLLLTSALNGQQLFDIEIDASGAQREVAFLSNINNTPASSIKLQLQSGTASDQGTLGLTAFGKTYAATPGYAGFGVVTSFDDGIILRASEPTGVLRFMTGGGNVENNTRMFVNRFGQIGIGTAEPAKKLHIKEGDLYMDTNSGGEIIIK